jgi:AhpD family alkylhydroperoxidase
MPAFTPRMEIREFYTHVPELRAGLVAAGKAAESGTLDKKLIELVKTRASQINGCAFCVQMHGADARKAGETDARLNLLAVWRDAPLFDDRERAALAWTEAVTRMAAAHVEDDLYTELKAHFSAPEIAHLTATIAVINAWNRIAAPLHFTPMA